MGKRREFMYMYVGRHLGYSTKPVNWSTVKRFHLPFQTTVCTSFTFIGQPGFRSLPRNKTTVIEELGIIVPFSVLVINPYLINLFMS